MKKLIIPLALSLAGSVFLAGCSKSGNSGAAGGSTNSSAAANAGGSSAPAGPVDLKIKWQIGKRYDMMMDLNQTTDINVPGQPVHQELKLTQGLDYSPLKELDNGGHQVRLQFASQTIDINQNGKDVLSYDSNQSTPIETNGPVGAVAAAMHAMVGAPLDFTFAADGTVESIDGIDALSNSIAAAVPNERQRLQVQQLYDEDTLKQYGAFAQSLPNHPVNVGDSWSESHDINNPAGVMTINSNYTFKNWEQHNGHNCVHLVITGDIKTKTASASMIGAVIKIKSGSISGDAWFDPDLGMFIDINSDQDTTLDITTRQMALTQEMKQNVDLSLQGIN